MPHLRLLRIHRLASYLSWRTRERIGIVLGMPVFMELFDEKYYTDLPAAFWRTSGVSQE
jgi:hypothetical protein